MSAGSSSTILKRAHSTQDSQSTSTHLPQLPQISGDIILQVFTHKSLRRSKSSHKDSDYCNERLSELGRVVLRTTITKHLFSRVPPLKVSELGTTTNAILSDANVMNWVTTYGLRDKVRCAPDAESLFQNSEEARVLFNSYVGGVFVESGIDTVQEWINLLIEPGRSGDEEPPSKKMKSEPISPVRSSAPPSSPPPPAIFYQPVPNPGAPGLPFLSVFNQAANQRRVTVEYQAKFSGPAHAGTWTVTCVVSGIEKGVGSGVSKHTAKEAAARQAYYSMGWAPHG